MIAYDGVQSADNSSQATSGFADGQAARERPWLGPGDRDLRKMKNSVNELREVVENTGLNFFERCKRTAFCVQICTKRTPKRSKKQRILRKTNLNFGVAGGRFGREQGGYMNRKPVMWDPAPASGIRHPKPDT
jgi:hypothetical protein